MYQRIYNDPNTKHHRVAAVTARSVSKPEQLKSSFCATDGHVSHNIRYLPRLYLRLHT